MPTIHLQTRIRASIERCFDLARSVDVHVRPTAQMHERAVGGVTSGLIGPGGSVTWEAVHFGIHWRLTSRITEYRRPEMFVDEMVDGPFRSMQHIHQFVPLGDETLMLDTFRYVSRFGPLGLMVDGLFLEQYLREFLAKRNQYLREVAEAGDR